MSAQGDLLERTDLQNTDAGDHDRFAHYFRKTDLDRALFDAVEITALCGKKDRPLRNPGDYPVCPTCKDIMENVVGSNLPGGGE